MFNRLTKNRPTMNKKIATALSALERNMGIDFVLDLYDDFLATDAFASYAGFRDRLTAAYADASPEWADIIRGQAGVYCDPAAKQAAYFDIYIKRLD